jgi:hypothetical protein
MKSIIGLFGELRVHYGSGLTVRFASLLREFRRDAVCYRNVTRFLILEEILNGSCQKYQYPF